MPITINSVTNFKEILFIAEVRGDDGSTTGYISTSTEAYTTDILRNTWAAVASSVVVLVICLLLGGVIIYKSKKIF